MSVMQERRTVLVVDDEPFIADVEKVLLERSGYICRVAHDYDSAVQVHEEMNPDIVLLDLSMNGKNGMDILESMHEKGESEVYIVSGVNDPDVVERCMEKGAKGYLLKPFKARELVQLIGGKIEKTDKE